MKNIFLFLVLATISISATPQGLFKFTPTDKMLFDEWKIDIQSLQLYSPDMKIFLTTIKGGTSNNINPKTCRIEKLDDLKTERIYFRPLTKLTCVKAEGTDLYISYDISYPPLVFFEEQDGYTLKTNKNGCIEINGKNYMCSGAFYLMVKGKTALGRNTIILPVKGASPSCK